MQPQRRRAFLSQHNTLTSFLCGLFKLLIPLLLQSLRKQAPYCTYEAWPRDEELERYLLHPRQLPSKQSRLQSILPTGGIQTQAHPRDISRPPAKETLGNILTYFLAHPQMLYRAKQGQELPRSVEMLHAWCADQQTL